MGCRDCFEYDDLGWKLCVVSMLTAEIVPLSYSLVIGRQEWARNVFLGLLPACLFIVTYRCIMSHQQRERMVEQKAQNFLSVAGLMWIGSGLQWLITQLAWPRENVSEGNQVTMMVVELMSCLLGFSIVSGTGLHWLLSSEARLHWAHHGPLLPVNDEATVHSKIVRSTNREEPSVLDSVITNRWS